ncbi:MAG: hypothetical protein MUP55_02745 [Candidatus Aenigmarchaeota archaeon]|nr:hypothetical protein [Candidatus Aenigmarchaeota archaeon]
MTTGSGILANIGIGALGAGGGIFSPKTGTMAATLATTFQAFRTTMNTSALAVLNSVYTARTSLSSLRVGTNMINAVKDIKLIVPSSESSSDSGSDSGSGTQEPGLGGE